MGSFSYRGVMTVSFWFGTVQPEVVFAKSLLTRCRLSAWPFRRMVESLQRAAAITTCSSGIRPITAPLENLSCMIWTFLAWSSARTGEFFSQERGSTYGYGHWLSLFLCSNIASQLE